MQSEPISIGEVLRNRVDLGGGIGRRRGHFGAKKVPHDHEAPMDDRCAIGCRSKDQEARLGEDPNAMGIVRQVEGREIRARRFHSVHLRQRRPELGLLVGEEVGQIATFGHRDARYEPDDFLLHLAEQTLRDAALVVRCSRIQPVKLQPILGVSLEATARSRVGDDTVGNSLERGIRRKLAALGRVQELERRGRHPGEVGQSRSHFEVARRRLSPLGLLPSVRSSR